jgi:hypothetical protein
MLKGNKVVKGLMLVVVVMLVGCASAPKPQIAAPNFTERTRSVKKIGVVLAGSYVYELGVGGSKVLNQDWSTQAANNLLKVSVDQLKLAGYDARLLKPDGNLNFIVDNFNSINNDILTRYVYSARKIQAPFSIAMSELLDKEGLDAVVFVRGIDHVSTTGRQAMKVAVAIMGAGISSGIAHIELAMVDKYPAFIYYSHKYEDGKDLRTESGVSDLFAGILEDLQELRGISKN